MYEPMLTVQGAHHLKYVHNNEDPVLSLDHLHTHHTHTHTTSSSPDNNPSSPTGHNNRLQGGHHTINTAKFFTTTTTNKRQISDNVQKVITSFFGMIPFYKFDYSLLLCQFQLFLWV